MEAGEGTLVLQCGGLEALLSQVTRGGGGEVTIGRALDRGVAISGGLVRLGGGGTVSGGLAGHQLLLGARGVQEGLGLGQTHAQVEAEEGGEEGEEEGDAPAPHLHVVYEEAEGKGRGAGQGEGAGCNGGACKANDTVAAVCMQQR